MSWTDRIDFTSRTVATSGGFAVSFEESWDLLTGAAVRFMELERQRADAVDRQTQYAGYNTPKPPRYFTTPDELFAYHKRVADHKRGYSQANTEVMNADSALYELVERVRNGGVESGMAFQLRIDGADYVFGMASNNGMSRPYLYIRKVEPENAEADF